MELVGDNTLKMLLGRRKVNWKTRTAVVVIFFGYITTVFALDTGVVMDRGFEYFGAFAFLFLFMGAAILYLVKEKKVEKEEAKQARIYHEEELRKSHNMYVESLKETNKAAAENYTKLSNQQHEAMKELNTSFHMLAEVIKVKTNT